MKHNPDHVAHLAALLLTGRDAVEPHHARDAVASAKLILELSHAEDEPEAAAEAPAEADADADGE